MATSTSSSSSHRGILISFEGGEGGGKTVQIKRLRDHFFECGREVVALREPGGTTISEEIRNVVLSSKNIGIAYTTEVLLFQAARAQLYREIVLPSLEAGKVVLMDRTRDSSVVYQGIVRGFGEDLIEQLNDISTEKTFPDVTFLLDVDPEIGLERRRLAESDGGKKMDRLDMEALDFHKQVRDAYLKVAKRDTRKRWTIVDASKTIDQISEAIWDEIVARKICE
jgi:dTMP kinase